MNTFTSINNHCTILLDKYVRNPKHKLKKSLRVIWYSSIIPICDSQMFWKSFTCLYFQKVLVTTLFTMTELQEQIAELLQCPVCFLLPRKLPIQSCSQGHIICHNCKPSVRFCPICRGSLMYNTNTLAGHIASILPHFCKFQVFGCQAKLSFETVEQHEKSCPERTVVCPFREDINRGIVWPIHSVEIG